MAARPYQGYTGRIKRKVSGSPKDSCRVGINARAVSGSLSRCRPWMERAEARTRLGNNGNSVLAVSTAPCELSCNKGYLKFFS